MKVIMLSAALILILFGIILQRLGQRHRSNESPSLRHQYLKPALWFRVDKVAAWRTPNGLKLHMIGYTLLAAGMGLAVFAIGFLGDR